MKNRLMSEEEGYTKRANIDEKKCSGSPRSGIDRRSGVDRRQIQNLNRPINDESQRRHYKEQRKTGELRADWVRISTWSSMFIGRS